MSRHPDFDLPQFPNSEHLPPLPDGIIRPLVIYLSGPIQNCTDEEIFGWRKHVVSETMGWAQCIIPPVYKIDVVNRENSKPIVEGDKKNIEASDVLLLNVIPGKPSTGTHQEEMFAYYKGIYVVVVHPEDKEISPWLLYHSDIVFSSLNEAIKHIKEYFAK